jgi:hypothetical protein
VALLGATNLVVGLSVDTVVGKRIDVTTGPATDLVTRTRTLRTGGNHDEETTGNHSDWAGGDRKVLTGGDLDEHTGGKHSVKGDERLFLHGPREFELLGHDYITASVEPKKTRTATSEPLKGELRLHSYLAQLSVGTASDKSNKVSIGEEDIKITTKKGGVLVFKDSVYLGTKLRGKALPKCGISVGPTEIELWNEACSITLGVDGITLKGPFVKLSGEQTVKVKTMLYDTSAVQNKLKN